jgi:hypothetical protein
MLRNEQISISFYFIYYKKILTFIRAGRLLHFFFLCSLVFLVISVNQIKFEGYDFISIYGFLSLFFFSWCITTELDAYSRYQNYKIAKDLFYKHGFRPMIAKPFSKSSCQRDAAAEAGRQLGLSDEIEKYFYNMGYRWHHIIPSMLIENPLLFFTKGYWTSTFFVPCYKSKYFHW